MAIPARVRDLTGRRFGRLTVVAFAGISEQHSARWLCACSCGNEKTINAQALTTGNTVSCGCKRRSNLRTGHWRGRAGWRARAV